MGVSRCFLAAPGVVSMHFTNDQGFQVLFTVEIRTKAEGLIPILKSAQKDTVPLPAVIQVESFQPGGMAFGSELIHHALSLLRVANGCDQKGEMLGAVIRRGSLRRSLFGMHFRRLGSSRLP